MLTCTTWGKCQQNKKILHFLAMALEILKLPNLL